MKVRIFVQELDWRGRGTLKEIAEDPFLHFYQLTDALRRQAKFYIETLSFEETGEHLEITLVLKEL